MCFNQFISDLTQNAQAVNRRRLVVLAGEEQWAIRLLSAMANAENALWLGAGEMESCIPMAKASSVLGREYAHLVFNSYSGFHPDAFGQSVGTLAGGGICFVIAPSFDLWPAYDDPDSVRYLSSTDQPNKGENYFIRRLIRLIESEPTTVTVRQNEPLEQVSLLTHAQYPLISDSYAEQKTAIEQVVKTATGRRGRPLVLTADRGRGKSSALGIAAAQLLKSKLSLIAVTAPNRRAVDSLFKHAMLTLDGAKLTKLSLLWQGKEVRFIAPDELSQELPECQLLLVDEAAAIPTPMLTTFAKHYSRVVFATTIHGYEGTGRGFSLRFVKTLKQLSPNMRTVELNQPIRWATNDPLEIASNEILGLNFNGVNPNSLVGVEHDGLVFKQLNQRELFDNESLLNQVFDLLVIAHYQTSPSDFRQLLDAPDLYVFAAFHHGVVVATALVLREGELDQEITQHVWQGTRRLRGHLLAQSLVAQVGLEHAGKYSYARIMRIAVHPQLQEQGFGKSLEQYISHWAKSQAIDFIGASFGATSSLSCFWLKHGYHAVRLGITKDQASGTHSLLVLKPLQHSNKLSNLIVQARDKFACSLRYSLSGKFNQLEFELVCTLLNNTLPTRETFTEQSRDIESYITTDRPFEQVDYVLEQLLWQQPACLATITPEQQQLVVVKILQQYPWSNVVELVGGVGKKQVKKQLKQAVTDIINMR